MKRAVPIPRTLALLAALVVWLAPPAFAGPAPDDTAPEEAAAADIDAVRAELERRRESRMALRERLENSGPATQRALSGYLSLETEYGWGGHDRDLDTTLRFHVQMGDDTVDDVTGAVSGRLRWDMDGLAGGSRLTVADDAAFVDYNDLRDDGLTQRIYTAYVDFNRLGPLDKLRLGRQFHDGYAGGHFDGIRLTASPFESTILTLYGGIPVNEHKIAGNTALGTDRIYGGMISSRFIDDLAVSLDVQGYRDRTEFYGTHHDSLAILGLRYDFLENLRASVLETVLNGEQRDLNCNAVYWNTEHDLSLNLNYVWMAERLEDLSNGYTPYTDVMARLEPYHLFRVTGTKGLGSHVEVGGGFTAHELIDASDETVFDKEYTRTEASFTLVDLPIEDLRATVHFEMWDSTDDDQYTIGGDARYRVTGNHTVEAGTYFSRLKYRQVSFELTENVRTHYLKWRWTVTRDVSLLLRGEIDNVEDVETYTVVSAGLTYRF